MTVRIVEGQLPYSGGTGIGIDANKVISLLLREENNLIQVNDDNEIYTDLQLVDNIKPTDEFPVGVTVGKILQSNGWTQSGLLLNRKTTSGDYARWIYANDGKVYFDNGTGVWKQVYYSSEVDNLIQTLRNYVDTFQPKLTAGTGIVIDQNNVISTTGGQGTGDVIGPNSSTDGNLAVFDGITGKALKDGGPIPAPTTVVDALDSTSTTSALSANQGRILDGKIADMMGLGKFLSLWNSTTGQPISFPLATPYTYTTGDYFIIEVVSSATPPVNYRPTGSSYTGTASSVAETDEIEIGDVYVYDGQTWLLQSNHGKTVAFANIAGQPTDNTALANALNAKQNTLTAGTNIDITNNTISAEGLTILSYGNSTWNDFITAYNRGGIVYCRASSNSNPGSGTQGRMAFMAYLNNPTTPTEVEFQYYRSRSSHSQSSTQLDEVYVYKLTNAGVWTTTQRDTGAEMIAGTGIGITFNSSGATINNTGVTSVNGNTGAVTVEEVPSGGTEGQVLTQTNNGPAWQNATGGADIVYATQAEYTALLPGALTDNKHYFIYSTSGGGGWQPGANTIAYYPLESDINDHSGNGYNLTGIGTVAYTQVGGASINSYNTTSSSNYLYSTNVTGMVSGASVSTTSLWFYYNGTTNPSHDQTIMLLGEEDVYNGCRTIFLNSNSSIMKISQWGASSGTISTLQANTWYNIVLVYDGSKFICYINGALAGNWTYTVSTSGQKIYIANNPAFGADNGAFSNYSNFILEDKAWSAQDVSDYFDLTKGDYGIS